MRSIAIVSLSLLGSCSFIDDFDKFHASEEVSGDSDGGGIVPIDDDAGGTGGDDDAASPKPDATKDAAVLVDAGRDAGGGGRDARVADDSAVTPPDAGNQTTCGDGVIDFLRGETCDDRNTIPNDGCEPVTCTVTPFPFCMGMLCNDNDRCTVDTCKAGTGCNYEVIDADKDGFSPGFCGVGSQHAGGDCNDSDDTVYPGAAEVCDGVDNNCDMARVVDEGLPRLRCYPDADRDGFANLDGAGTMNCSCPPGRMAVANPQDRSQHDCYDDPEDGADVHPGQLNGFERGYGRNGNRSYDYDCDGDEQPLYDALPSGGCKGLLVLCVGESGFEDMLPGCGESGRYSVCSELDLGCGGQSEMRRQLCN